MRARFALFSTGTISSTVCALALTDTELTVLGVLSDGGWHTCGEAPEALVQKRLVPSDLCEHIAAQAFETLRVLGYDVHEDNGRYRLPARRWQEEWAARDVPAETLVRFGVQGHSPRL
jgi:hypothetical protein